MTFQADGSVDAFEPRFDFELYDDMEFGNPLDPGLLAAPCFLADDATKFSWTADSYSTQRMDTSTPMEVTVDNMVDTIADTSVPMEVAVDASMDNNVPMEVTVDQVEAQKEQVTSSCPLPEQIKEEQQRALAMACGQAANLRTMKGVCLEYASETPSGAKISVSVFQVRDRKIARVLLETGKPGRLPLPVLFDCATGERVHSKDFLATAAMKIKKVQGPVPALVFY